MAMQGPARTRWRHSRSRGGGTRPVDHGRMAASADMNKDYLSLKRMPTGANVEDYDVLCGGAVVGRIFLSQAGKWMWASNDHEGRAPAVRRRGEVRGGDGGIREKLAKRNSREGRPMSINGTYGFVYCGNSGLGIGVFSVEGQRLEGRDFAGGIYEGAAVQDGKGNIEIDVQMQLPGGFLEQGTEPQDLLHTRHIHWTFPAAFGDGEPQMVEFAGPVTVIVKRIPDVNAAIAKHGFTPETTAHLGGFRR